MAVPTKRRWPHARRHRHGRQEISGLHTEEVKDKNSEVRLMGFGHRVYKNYDPRAKIMQKMCHAVLAETGHGDNTMLKVASGVGKNRLAQSVFHRPQTVSECRLLFGHHAESDGLPDRPMFTVLFAVARTVGWMSQWSEMIEDPQQKIGRPRQLYTGVARRDYLAYREAEVAAFHFFEAGRGTPRPLLAVRRYLRPWEMPSMLSRRHLARSSLAECIGGASFVHRGALAAPHRLADLPARLAKPRASSAAAAASRGRRQSGFAASIL